MAVILPDWITPMAATLTEKRFTGPNWVFEQKFDGVRLLAFKQDGHVRLFSRNRLPQHLPVVAEAIARLPVEEVILDGEVTYDNGVSYHVFDVMWLGRREVMTLPLDERRALLDALPLAGPINRVESLAGEEPWTVACREGWEGVIAKRRDSQYEQRRSPHWLKMKCEVIGEFIVGGFTDPQGARIGLGALLVGHFHGEEFVYAGKVGTGFDTKLLLDLRARLNAIEIPAPPFTRAVGLPRIRAHWVKPAIAVRLAFIEWTVHGKLRHSRLLSVTS